MTCIGTYAASQQLQHVLLPNRIRGPLGAGTVIKVLTPPIATSFLSGLPPNITIAYGGKATRSEISTADPLQAALKLPLRSGAQTVAIRVPVGPGELAVYSSSHPGDLSITRAPPGTKSALITDHLIERQLSVSVRSFLKTINPLTDGTSDCAGSGVFGDVAHLSGSSTIVLKARSGVACIFFALPEENGLGDVAIAGSTVVSGGSSGKLCVWSPSENRCLVSVVLNPSNTIRHFELTAPPNSGAFLYLYGTSGSSITLTDLSAFSISQSTTVYAVSTACGGTSRQSAPAVIGQPLSKIVPALLAGECGPVRQPPNLSAGG